MYIDELREHALALPGVEETTPFGPDTLVYKVGGKMFLLCGVDGDTMNVKCEPERAVQLREDFPESIRPGWHMNKTHWNTVALRNGLPTAALHEHIAHSYALIVESLPKAKRPAGPAVPSPSA